VEPVDRDHEPGAPPRPLTGPILLEPDSLVVLVGASGSGKSYWAHTHFRDTQVVSSDRCRALVSDDEENQGVHREAFAVFYTLLRQRAALGRLSVADSTGLHEHSRRRMVSIARESGRPVHAVAFVAPPELLLRHNRLRTRRVPDAVLLHHDRMLRLLLESGALNQEGFDSVRILVHPYSEGVPALLPRAPETPRS
jgi:protein phosphatase